MNLVRTSEARQTHADQAEAILAMGRDGDGAAATVADLERAQVHALLAIFYQGEARDLAGLLS